MKIQTYLKATLPLAAASAALAFQNADAARWDREARNVTIVRDDWGIAHVHGKTDADAVFGMIYAQAEDDFFRIESNYITTLGKQAEAEGEGRLYQDLRMRLFLDPETLKKQYARKPGVVEIADERVGRWVEFLYCEASRCETAGDPTLRTLDGAELDGRERAAGR